MMSHAAACAANWVRELRNSSRPDRPDGKCRHNSARLSVTRDRRASRGPFAGALHNRMKKLMERAVAYGGLGFDGSDVQYEDATSALTRIGQRRRLACTRPSHEMRPSTASSTSRIH